MKKLLFILFIFPSIIYAQRYGEDAPNNITLKKYNEQQVFKLSNKSDSLQYEMAYLRYCLYSHCKQYNTGLVISLIGSVTFVSSIAIDNESIRNILLLGGAAGALLGEIIIWDSHKWFRRASIKPTTYGVKFEVNF